jgi:hypothetical protein
MRESTARCTQAEEKNRTGLRFADLLVQPRPRQYPQAVGSTAVDPAAGPWLLPVVLADERLALKSSTF